MSWGFKEEILFSLTNHIQLTEQMPIFIEVVPADDRSVKPLL
jgi:PII-like signaling protein